MRPPTHLASDVFLRRLLMRTSISGAVSGVSLGAALLGPLRLVRGVSCGRGSLGLGPGLRQVREVKKRHDRIVPHVCVHTMNGSPIGCDAWVIV